MSLVVVVIGAFAMGALSRLEPAAPSVSRDVVVIDTVRRGTMTREVSASGSLVPISVTWITSSSDGRIIDLPLKPGIAVDTDTVLLKLANPELNKDAQDAQLALDAANAELGAAKQRLNNQLLELQGSFEEVTNSLEEAELQWAADQQLYEDSLISGQKHALSKKRCEQLVKRVENAQKKVDNFRESMKPQLKVQDTKIKQANAILKLKQQQVEDLTICARKKGILQQLGTSGSDSSRPSSLAIGQWVTAGVPLAMITDPTDLQAELRVPEVQARDLLLGQAVEIDARVAKIKGKVKRIDPASNQGNVTIDIELEGELPQGARPDLSVTGKILIEQLDDVLHTGRIIYGETGKKVGVFRVEADGTHATRVTATLGRSSVHTIEIVDGLQEGDQIIVSDTKRWEEHSRIRLD